MGGEKKLEVIRSTLMSGISQLKDTMRLKRLTRITDLQSNPKYSNNKRFMNWFMKSNGDEGQTDYYYRKRNN